MAAATARQYAAPQGHGHVPARSTTGRSGRSGGSGHSPSNAPGAMEASTSSTFSSRSQQASQPSDTPAPKKPLRQIGRWYLGETLGKGGYSWVKKGRDCKTKKCVALKFMEKKKKTTTSGSKQFRQVKTEIEALKHMKHPHIVRLLAYNLNTKYPDAATRSDYESGEFEIKDGVVYKRDVILLVLEYMPGGELFDILYYTSKLDQVVARTYLHQLISGLDALHKASIVHRDIKPQNLLLSRSFSLKITDFGLAKLQESDADMVMDTFNVGTRGYQAPEVLLKQPYTSACDIFSVGVVLFILLAGYPPFEHARADDRWYSAIARHDYKGFWRSHKGCGITVPAQDLISRMLRFDSQKRISIAEMTGHPWFRAEKLDTRNLHKVLRLRHMQMEMKRAKDPIKTEIMATSARKKAPGGGKKTAKVKKDNRPMLEALKLSMERQNLTIDSQAMDLDESGEGIGMLDVFTTKKYIEVLNVIGFIVQDECKGNVLSIGLKDCSMTVDLRMITQSPMDPSKSITMGLKVVIKVYRSDEFKCNVVKFYRIDGSHRVFREFIKYLTRDTIFTGVPPDQLDDLEREVAEAKAESKLTHQLLTSERDE